MRNYKQIIEKVSILCSDCTEDERREIINRMYNKGGVNIGCALDDRARHAGIHAPRGRQKNFNNRY